MDTGRIVTRRERRLAMTGKKRRRRLLLITLFIFLLLPLSLYIYLSPGMVQVPWGEGMVLVIDLARIGEDLALIEEREAYIPVEILREYLDPHFFWDAGEETAIITTADRVVHMHSEELTTEINLQPVDLQFPLRREGKTLYLPLLFLADFYDLEIEYFPHTDTLVIDHMEQEASWAVLTAAARLRREPGIRSPYFLELPPGEKVLVKDFSQDWCLVRSSSGITGYLPGKVLSVTGPYIPSREPSTGGTAKPELPDLPLVMAWEFTYPNPRVEEIGPMPSLQILSPTWFHLNDSEGNIKNLADPAYIRWAHEQGYQVWALFSNSLGNTYDPALTGEFLNSTARRKKAAHQLILYARLYNLDGLNLDFENINLKDRDLYTQFVRELAPLCRQEGLVLSVDVTFISMNPNWSLCYDRPALAEAVDFVIVMAYDEYWHSCPLPGPVASPPWVERGVQAILQEVTAEKLILGVPFYTRVWQVENRAGGDISLAARDFGLNYAENFLREKEATLTWDPLACQQVATYTEDGNTYKFWVEDEDTMRRRLELVQNYNLAGVAGWRRGLELPFVWEVIQEAIGREDH